MKRVGSFLAFGLLIAVLPAQESKQAEPDPLATWCDELASTDAAESFRAEQQLLRHGARAVPALLRTLERSKNRSRAARRALEVLGRLGRDGTAALPKLMERLREAGPTTEAVLAAIDGIAPYAPDQHDDIVEALADRWMNRQHGRHGGRTPTSAICRTKVRLSVHSDLPLKELIETLATGNSIEREAVAQLIVDAEGPRQTKIDALRAALNGAPGPSRVRVRFRTARMSASISTSIRNDARERRAIALALAGLATTKDVPAEAWIALLDHRDPRIVRRAIQGAIRAPTAADARSAVTRLVALADNKNPRDKTLAWDAITALGMLGANGQAALSPLRRLQKSRDKAVAVRARAAIRSIEKAIEKRE